MTKSEQEARASTALPYKALEWSRTALQSSHETLEESNARIKASADFLAAFQARRQVF